MKVKVHVPADANGRFKFDAILEQSEIDEDSPGDDIVYTLFDAKLIRELQLFGFRPIMWHPARESKTVNGFCRSLTPDETIDSVKA